MSERVGKGRRYAVVASVIAATAAVALFVGVSDEALPHWLARRVGGVTPLSMQGGTLIHYRMEGDGDGWQAVEQIGRRIDAWNVPGASAYLAEDGHLVIVLPGVRPDRREVFSGLLETGGKLEFRMVVHDHPTMRAIYREVDSDQGARRLGIEAETDTWSHEESNRPFYDHYVSALDPRGLDLYLGELFQKFPELRPDADHQLLYELTHRHDEDGVTERPIVRTYLVERQVHLGNGDIQDAEVTYNPQVNRPEVLVTFTREGGELFGDLTAGHVGHKLAIILDGRIHSAPVIQSAIRGGRSTITMGGTDPAKLEAEARDLAGVLRAGALDVKLEQLGMEDRPATASASSLLAARGLFALGCGLLLLAALLIGRRLGAAAAGDRLPGPVLPAGRWPWLRVGVTAAVVLALWKLAPRLRLPTLDDRIDQYIMVGQHRPSVFELGVSSVLLAFVLVELAALIVPPWRRLRHAGFAGRGALGPAVLIVAVLLAGLQAWAFAGYFDLVGLSSPHVPAVRWVAVITLVTGVVMVFVAAWVADRWGLLSGWSTVVLASVAGGVEIWWKMVRDPVAPVGVATLVKVLLLATAIALATLAVLRSPRAGDRRPFVRGPAAGWVPITGAITLLSFLAFVFALGWLDWPTWLIDLIYGTGPAPGATVDATMEVFHRSTPRTAVTLALVAVLAAAFAVLYSRPGLWREARRRLRGGQPADPAAERTAFVRAALIGGAWAMAVAVMVLLLHRSGVESITPLTTALLLPAVLTDAVVEWRARARHRDLVTVWPLHQVQMADEVASVLAAEGIAAHLRGLRFRSLMHFFGPEVPIAVMVPLADAERAHRLLAERLTPR